MSVISIYPVRNIPSLGRRKYYEADAYCNKYEENMLDASYY